ncbi:MAG: hypothetical protein JNM47_00580 [Hyphomonadaceae bacterium]|nr:hypothetical protein [Hyphomonadaceae bacterium]
MTVADFAGLAAACIACAGALGVVLARRRLTMALAFAVAAIFAGLAVMASGLFDAGGALIAAGLLAALLAIAAGGAIGEMLTLALRPAPLALAALALCAVTLLLAWPNAPTPPTAAPPRADASAFDAPRAGDLLIALAAFAAVGAGVVAVAGFGARGLFGPDRDSAP